MGKKGKRMTISSLEEKLASTSYTRGKGYYFIKYKEKLETFNREQTGSILKHFFIELRRELLENNICFQIPFNLGRLEIIEMPEKEIERNVADNIKSHAVDWGETRKLWVTKYGKLSNAELKQISDKPLIYHFNEHSDGKYSQTQWHKAGVYGKYINFYKFKPIKSFKKAISVLCKEGTRFNSYQIRLQ